MGEVLFWMPELFLPEIRLRLFRLLRLISSKSLLFTLEIILQATVVIFSQTLAVRFRSLGSDKIFK